MGITKGPIFSERDVFVRYDFESVMFRWDHVKGLIYRRFYGELEHPEPVPHDNRLFNEALLHGEEISREEYERGRSEES